MECLTLNKAPHGTNADHSSTVGLSEQREPLNTDNERAGPILDFLSRYTLLIALVVLAAFFSLVEPNRFFTIDNFRALAAQQVVIVLLAVAATVPLLAGEFDVSVGYVAGLTQAFVIGLMANQHLSIPAAIATVLAMALAVGLVNGLLVVKLKINALIATLAVGSVLTGIVRWYTGGYVIFQGIPKAFTDLAQGDLLGVPRPIVYGVVIAALLAFYFSFLPGGRRLYAIGGNRAAALLNGINVERHLILAFGFSALLSGLAGVLIASQIGVADPSVGPQFLLPAFTAAFLGATAFRPGRFNVMGTVVGAYVLAVPITGLQELGIPNWFQAVFNGAALIIAVAASGQIKQLRARRARRARLRLTTLAFADEPKLGSTESEKNQSPASSSSSHVHQD